MGWTVGGRKALRRQVGLPNVPLQEGAGEAGSQVRLVANSFVGGSYDWRFQAAAWLQAVHAADASQHARSGYTLKNWRPPAMLCSPGLRLPGRLIEAWEALRSGPA